VNLELTKSYHSTVLRDITRTRVLAELDALPIITQDRSASVILNSLQSPNAILGFRRLARHRWFVHAICFHPRVEPVNVELTTTQARNLVNLFFTNTDWLYLMRTQ